MSLLGSIGGALLGSVVKSVFGSSSKNKTPAAPTGSSAAKSRSLMALPKSPETVQKFAPDLSGTSTSGRGAGVVARNVPSLTAVDPQATTARIAAIFARAKQESKIG
jgi:hypothetical protein